MYKINSMITLQSATIELDIDQIRDLVHSGQTLHELYDGALPIALRPIVYLCDDLATLLQMEASHA